MTYEEWKQTVSQQIKNDSVWKFFGYRKALFLYDLTWKDCKKLDTDQVTGFKI